MVVIIITKDKDNDNDDEKNALKNRVCVDDHF